MRRQRVVVVFVVAMACFLMVLLRLVRLQVVERDMWSRESARSSARYVSRSFSRGWILDRNGQPLAASEEAHDLVFTYRTWRRGAVAGQAALAWWTLGWDDPGQGRPSVTESVRRVGPAVAALGQVSLGAIAEIQPRQRRLDLGFYLARLFGQGVWDELRELLVLDAPPRDFRVQSCAGFAKGLNRAQRRAEREALALKDLSRVTKLSVDDLLATMDGAADAVQQRVARAQQRSGTAAEGPETLRERYRRRQELAAAFDGLRETVVESVPYDATTLVAIRSGELSGFDIKTEDRRIYPPEVADVAPLIIGKVGSPGADVIGPADAHRIELADLASLEDLTAEELTRYEELVVAVRETDYRRDEECGSLMGIELAFEEVLRGRRGWVTELIDERTTHREEREPLRGLDVTLTLDASLQRAAQESLDLVFRRPPAVSGQAADSPAHWRGSIVLLDPRSGQILVAATGPRPTRDELGSEYNRLVADEQNRPLTQRAFDGGGNLPPPGSTFKPAVALAALAAGVITPTSTFHCAGRLAVGRRTMGCLGHHGDISVREALARSCNIYFYQAGRALGMERMLQLVQVMGFGDRSGLVLRNPRLAELGVPLRGGVHEAHPRLGPAPYTSTDAMRLAIGQAPLDDVTPLQVASMMGAIGCGVLVPPQLVASVEGYGDVPSRRARPLPMESPALAVVRQALADVVERSYGTAHELLLRLPAIARQVAAKTGTAQVQNGRDHAWFAGFMPRENPRLAFAVFIEDCGFHGGEAALPVFMDLLQRPAMAAFLESDVLPRRPEEVTR